MKRSKSRAAAKPQHNGQRTAVRNGGPMSQAELFRLMFTGFMHA